MTHLPAVASPLMRAANDAHRALMKLASGQPLLPISRLAAAPSRHTGRRRPAAGYWADATHALLPRGSPD